VLVEIERGVPRWAVPLNAPARFKGAHGGRGGGKSHEFAARLVERHAADPFLRSVGIREVQKSLTFSVKSLVEAKIRELGVDHLFTVQDKLIRHRFGPGVILFQGMQDHTAESIKSLEGFGIAYVEEAQALSKRSLTLLVPTIRAPGSEIWFSWNPDQPSDAVDHFLRTEQPKNAVVVSCHYRDNPWVTAETLEDAARMAATDPDAYAWVWEGGYNTRSASAVLAGKWVIDEFDVEDDWDGPYHGLDFGFGVDPTAGVRMWIGGRTLYVERELYRHRLELDDTPAAFGEAFPNGHLYPVRCDNSRPESISHLKRHGLPRAMPCDKWPGSVEDGIAHLRAYDRIVVHPRCPRTVEEMRLYSYKVDKRSGDILPVIVDKHNHIIDAMRYGLGPLITNRGPNFLLRA